MNLSSLYERTYTSVSRERDLGIRGPAPALKAQRAVQDALMAERHRGFDLAAKDRTPKSARRHFSVVGEGSRTAQERYRANFGLIDWRS